MAINKPQMFDASTLFLQIIFTCKALFGYLYQVSDLKNDSKNAKWLKHMRDGYRSNRNLILLMS